MPEKKKISKVKGQELTILYMYEGKTRKEILQILQDSYNISTSTVDKLIKDAKPKLDAKLREDDSIRSAETAKGITEAAKNLNVTRERLMQEYARIAFHDMGKLFYENGSLIPVSLLDEDTRAALQGVENLDVKAGEVNIGTTKKIKVASKLGALDSLSKIMGYFQKDSGENGPTEIFINGKKVGQE